MVPALVRMVAVFHRPWLHFLFFAIVVQVCPHHSSRVAFFLAIQEELLCHSSHVSDFVRLWEYRDAGVKLFL